MELLQYVLIVSAFFVGLIVGLIARGRNNGKIPPVKHDGFWDVSEEDENVHRMELITDPEELRNQENVVFKVRKG